MHIVLSSLWSLLHITVFTLCLCFWPTGAVDGHLPGEHQDLKIQMVKGSVKV